MSMSKPHRCCLRKGVFGRWVLVHPDDEDLAWSGAQWVPHVNRLSASLVQVCNFENVAEAERYAQEHDIEVIDNATI